METCSHRLEAEQIASTREEHSRLSRPATPIRVGFKVTEGTRTRVQITKDVCIARTNGQGHTQALSRFARFPSARASSESSLLYFTNIDSIEGRSAAARCVAPSSIYLSARVPGQIPPGSSRYQHLQRRAQAPTLKGKP